MAVVAEAVAGGAAVEAPAVRAIVGDMGRRRRQSPGHRASIEDQGPGPLTGPSPS